MRNSLCLSIVLGLLMSIAPHALADPVKCVATVQEQTALREASQRLAQANLSPGHITLQLDLSGHAYLSRAQVAVMIIRMLGWEAQVGSGDFVSPFSDVPADHWAAKYIALAWNEGIIKGEPGGTFAPDRRATVAEAELMLGRALRVAPNLTLDNTAQALSKAGIPTATSCIYDDGKSIDAWQYLLILDRAMSVPLYNRISASHVGTAT